MLELLSPSVWREISKEAASSKKPAHVAVAYFGKGGLNLLPLRPGSRLVVDASIDTVKKVSTHPASLEVLRASGVEVFSAQNLHAKVYAFDKIGFVGSPNVSHRSSATLIETVMRTNSAKYLVSMREFVDSICLTKLSKIDIQQLSKIYKPPTKKQFTLGQSDYSTLLMELTSEQGGSRMSQVQPPRAVWTNYFGLDVGNIHPMPSIKLTYLDSSPPSTVVRPIIKHHHVYTIELDGAGPPRPAILKMRKIGIHEFEYRIVRNNDKSFDRIEKLLQNVVNPQRANGRPWLLV